jgi:hypothetical protein
MLKKTLHITLSFLLLFSTAGFTITNHFCGKTLVRTAINSEPEPCCDMEGCCHNESEHFQVKDDFCITDNISVITAPVIDVFFNTIFITQLYRPSDTSFRSFPVAESPPPLKTDTLLSLFQTYLC